MKINPNITTFLIAVCLLLFVFSCKKDESIDQQLFDFTKIYGLWENEVTVLTVYDSLDNFVSEDTLLYTDANGVIVAYFESYIYPSTFLPIVDLTDTLQNHDFLIQDNRIIIDVDDEIFFSDRKVTVLNDTVLSMYNIYSGPPKRKFTQNLMKVN